MFSSENGRPLQSKIPSWPLLPLPETRTLPSSVTTAMWRKPREACFTFGTITILGGDIELNCYQEHKKEHISLCFYIINQMFYQQEYFTFCLENPNWP